MKSLAVMQITKVNEAIETPARCDGGLETCTRPVETLSVKHESECCGSHQGTTVRDHRVHVLRISADVPVSIPPRTDALDGTRIGMPPLMSFSERGQGTQKMSWMQPKLMMPLASRA